MQALSDTQALNWCSDRGLHVEPSQLPNAGLGGVEERRFRIRIPDEATAVVGLAYVLLMTGVAEYDEANFDGAIIWLRRWEIWSESIDKVGELLLDGLRGAPTKGGPLGDTPAWLYSKQEFVRAQACLSLPMLFQWDAYYAPAGADFLAFVSHHGHLEIIAPKDSYESLFQRLRDWNPEDA